ncbi:WD40 repeat-like protein [Suillus weaverae]|nr:WD40 repeat-like protein [Suillus weaverae]
MASTSMKVAGTKSILTPSMTLKGYGLCLQSISYIPDGQRMISRSYDKTTRQWDVKAGKEIKEARDVCEEEVWAVAVSKDSRWVVIGGGDHDRWKSAAWLAKVNTTPLRTFEGHARTVMAVAVFPDKRRMVTGSLDKTLRLWDLETGVVLKKMEGHSSTVEALVVSRDGQVIASGDANGEIIGWHGEIGESLTQPINKQLQSMS